MAQYIAETRFPWPDQNTNPEVTRMYGIWPDEYVTIVNAKKKQRAIQFGNKTWYPDIVIVNGKDEVREICEIELEEDISPAVIEKWKGYAVATRLGPHGYPKLFLYVPASKQTEVQEIISKGDLKYAGLRAYELSDDLNALKIIVLTTNEL
jgi:hypothetical protein